MLLFAAILCSFNSSQTDANAVTDAMLVPERCERYPIGWLKLCEDMHSLKSDLQVVVRQMDVSTGVMSDLQVALQQTMDVNTGVIVKQTDVYLNYIRDWMVESLKIDLQGVVQQMLGFSPEFCRMVLFTKNAKHTKDLTLSLSKMEGDVRRLDLNTRGIAEDVSKIWSMLRAQAQAMDAIILTGEESLRLAEGKVSVMQACLIASIALQVAMLACVVCSVSRRKFGIATKPIRIRGFLEKRAREARIHGHSRARIHGRAFTGAHSRMGTT